MTFNVDDFLLKGNYNTVKSHEIFKLCILTSLHYQAVVTLNSTETLATHPHLSLWKCSYNPVKSCETLRLPILTYPQWWVQTIHQGGDFHGVELVMVNLASLLPVPPKSGNCFSAPPSLYRSRWDFTNERNPWENWKVEMIQKLLLLNTSWKSEG